MAQLLHIHAQEVVRANQSRAAAQTLNGYYKVRERQFMPNYEFHCAKCQKTFELTWPLAEYDKRIKEKIKCPKCGSTRVAKIISLVEVKTAKKS
ncbi:MAG: FmdB family zinc ribbon protein [Chloroflexota bacterium]